MLYLDTSVVIALITRETYTDVAQVWLQEQATGETAISDWVTVEVSSALSIKERTGELNELDRARAERSLRKLSREVFDVLPVPRVAFASAAMFSARAELSLSASAALHLAIASERQARLCTLDSRQADAGRQLGLASMLLFSGDGT